MEPPKPRKLYGVPVFPGQSERPPTAPRPSASSTSELSTPSSFAVSQQTPPPSLSVVGTTAASDSCYSPAAVSSPPTVVANAPAMHWKLRHIDFAPNLIRGKKEDEFERFPVLVDRANQWSAQNTQALVFSCETVTWSSMDRQMFTDSGLLQKSMHSDKKSRYMRGLRVWYVVYDETFYDKNNCIGPYKLGFINYTLEGKNDNFQGLLAKINGDMFKKTVSGKILKVETMHMLTDVGDPDICGWNEQPEKNRDFASFMRIFYVLKKDGQEDTKYGEIGIRDFVPKFDQRTPLNQGYEVYADLWRSAARWMFTNPNMHFISAQGVFVKTKKESNDGKDSGPPSNANLWDRPTHREHGSAYGNMSHQKTEYVQILRLIYHQPPNAAATSATPGGATPTGAKLFYKSFSPAALRRVPIPGLPLSSAGQADDGDSAECTYEDLRQLEDKINAWLSYTGAKVHGVETIPTRLVTGGQEMLGPEATFVYNDREKNQGREYWRVNIRLYLDGEFKELAVPRSSLDDVTQRCVNGSVSSLN